jgi:two-component system, NtrC family, sensor kinase
MKWSIQTKLVIGFTIALLVLALTSLMSYTNTTALIRAQEDVTETRERLTELAGILTGIREAESGQRGYILTGEVGYLNPFERASRDVPGHFERFRALSAKLPEHEQTLGRLKSAIDDKFLDMQQSIDLRRANNSEAVRRTLLERRGVRDMRAIRQGVEEMANVERQRLARQVERSRENARRAPGIYFGLVLLEFLLLALGFYLVAHDVSHRKKTEDALRASELFYHSLVESLPQNIYRKDHEGRFSFANRRFCATVGRPLEEIANHTDLDLFPAPLAEKYRKDDARVIDTGEVFDTEEEHITPDGQKHYVQVIKTPLYDHNEEVIGTQGIFWDVTERRRAEERLRQQNEQLQAMALSERVAHEERKEAQSRMVETAKLAGLGQMVAGVAHEINNPLSFVSNNVAVLQRDLGELRDLLILYRSGDEVIGQVRPELRARIRELAETMDLDYTLGNLEGLLTRTRDGLKRIQQIVKDLRLFARLDESDLNEVDLNAGVESTVNIIEGHGKHKHVTIDLDLGDLPAVLCYPAKINQVVMNLVGNAIDASLEGGCVLVRTRADGSMVRIDIIDRGEGISPEIRDRIFEPFFTTKPVGIGTGLGLSISYGIVQDHGGTIEVTSVPGQETCFSILLPQRLPASPGSGYSLKSKTPESVA